MAYGSIKAGMKKKAGGVKVSPLKNPGAYLKAKKKATKKTSTRTTAARAQATQKRQERTAAARSQATRAKNARRAAGRRQQRIRKAR